MEYLQSGTTICCDTIMIFGHALHLVIRLKCRLGASYTSAIAIVPFVLNEHLRADLRHSILFVQIVQNNLQKYHMMCHLAFAFGTKNRKIER